MWLQRANKLPKALSAFRYGRRQCAVELTVKKELPVLGIEAHNIGGQYVDSEIRREPRNVFAVGLRKASPEMAGHEVRTRTLVTTPDRPCQAYSPAARAPSSSVSRSSVSR